jgi:hypothetical protein
MVSCLSVPQLSCLNQLGDSIELGLHTTGGPCIAVTETCVLSCVFVYGGHLARHQLWPNLSFFFAEVNGPLDM